MCFESMAWAAKQTLPAMQKIVLVILADHNSKDGLCFPSYETLAIECRHVNQTRFFQAACKALGWREFVKNLRVKRLLSHCHRAIIRHVTIQTTLK